MDQNLRLLMNSFLIKENRLSPIILFNDLTFTNRAVASRDASNLLISYANELEPIFKKIKVVRTIEFGSSLRAFEASLYTIYKRN